MRRARLVAVVAAAGSIALAIACGGSDSNGTASDAGSDAADATTGSADVSSGDDAGSAADAPGDAHCTYVDDANVTHGCAPGSQGPGDRDDGGGALLPPPDAALDATDLAFGASCWNNAQCASGVCFLYKVRGTLCTNLCGSSADCPDASLGCNGQGVCRQSTP